MTAIVRPALTDESAGDPSDTQRDTPQLEGPISEAA